MIRQVFHIDHTSTEVIHDTNPSYRSDYLPERYNEKLLLPTKLSLEQNNQIMKELNLIQYYNKHQMNYQKMNVYKNMLNNVDIVIEVLFNHTNTNLLVFHAHST